MPRECALLIPFREVAPVVEPWLEHSVGARPSHGIPPHVTILFPSPPDIGDALDGVAAFDVEFREARRFAVGVVWLAPEPSEPFVELTKRVWGRFPDWPPYGGEFLPDVTPHLTVAWGAMLDEAESAVRERLPLRARAREAVLFRREAPERWVVQSTFAFA
jgi:2'-5' RNA ligase superfamily